MFHQIIVARSMGGHRLWLEYEDGEAGEVDFGPLIKRGGVFAELAEPGVFDQVHIGERGRYVEWPGSVDFCADALREKLCRPAPTKGYR